jgi:nitrate/nitrite transporter NarK
MSPGTASINKTPRSNPSLNLQVWLSALAYFAILSGLYSFGLFLPTIINNGFAKNPNEAQLWTVIPYAVAAVFTVVTAFLSDRLALRGPVMLCTLPIAIIGYAVISQTTNPKVQYPASCPGTATTAQATTREQQPALCNLQLQMLVALWLVLCIRRKKRRNSRRVIVSC